RRACDQGRLVGRHFLSGSGDGLTDFALTDAAKCISQHMRTIPRKAEILPVLRLPVLAKAIDSAIELGESIAAVVIAKTSAIRVNEMLDQVAEPAVADRGFGGLLQRAANIIRGRCRSDRSRALREFSSALAELICGRFSIFRIFGDGGAFCRLSRIQPRRILSKTGRHKSEPCD